MYVSAVSCTAAVGTVVLRSYQCINPAQDQARPVSPKPKRHSVRSVRILLTKLSIELHADANANKRTGLPTNDGSARIVAVGARWATEPHLSDQWKQRSVGNPRANAVTRPMQIQKSNKTDWRREKRRQGTCPYRHAN